MNRQTLDLMWDHIRQMNGVALRCVAAIPADRIDSHPIPNMRTPKELLVHTYGTVIRAIGCSIATGSVPQDCEEQEAGIVATIQTRDELIRYCRACWDAADASLRTVTDAQLQAMVKTPFGSDYPGFVMFTILNDEFIHHRGQLYVYLRAMGVEPPMMWDFAHNDPAFQPKATAQA